MWEMHKIAELAATRWVRQHNREQQQQQQQQQQQESEEEEEEEHQVGGKIAPAVASPARFENICGSTWLKKIDSTRIIIDTCCGDTGSNQDFGPEVQTGSSGTSSEQPATSRSGQQQTTVECAEVSSDSQRVFPRRRSCELVCGDAFAAGSRSEALLAEATVVFCNCISWPPELKQALSEKVRAMSRTFERQQPTCAVQPTHVGLVWYACEGVQVSKLGAMLLMTSPLPLSSCSVGFSPSPASEWEAHTTFCALSFTPRGRIYVYIRRRQR